MADASKDAEAKKATVVTANKEAMKEELVASTPNERNWRGILIALLVIVAVLGMIMFSIVLLSPPDEGPRVKGRKFTLDDILGPHFNTPRFNGTWVSDSELVYRNMHGGVSLLNADNFTTTVLMTNSTFRRLNAVDFRVSSDLKFILLISDIRQVFKYSFEAIYNIYEVSTSNDFRLTPPGTPDGEHLPLQHVAWAPRGSALAFVYRNDVYYKPRAKERVQRLTDTGEPGVVYNGVPDWLYEEEILHSNNALWFSPDARLLLIATYNDSAVGELKYPWYGSRLRYPQIHALRYPKAGTANPVVTLSVVELSKLRRGNTTTTGHSRVTPTVAEHARLTPSTGVATDSYVTAVTWLHKHRVSVVWMNRSQNVTVIAVCTPPTWTCENTHTERASVGGWVDVYDPPLFSGDGSAYLVRLPVRDAENGYYKHVCHVSLASGVLTPLTSGPFEVTAVLGWDEEEHLVYFEAAPEQKPGQRHLYNVGDLNSSLPLGSWECLTCPPPYDDVDSSAGVPGVPANITQHQEVDYMTLKCLYSKHHLSPGNRFYVLECLGPDVPWHHLMELPNNTKLSELDNYDTLLDRYGAMAKPQIKNFQVEVSDSYQAQVKLYLPPGLRDYEEMQFPLILHVCAAPASQLVDERWTTEWATYLASSRNFIVAQIDARGSGYQGDKLLHEINNQLGSVEVEDQIAVIKYLRDNLKFVDKTRVAVWGWSYGGFATTMILAQDTGIFHCGIAVAPVASWAHYDSVFSERYMGSPADNYRRYDEADVTKRAGNLKDKMFLLIHGTADDTVHYQQSMLLVKALTKEGVLFRHQTYPDEGHTFAGVQDHFYKAMEAFLDDCFGPLDFEDWEVGTSFFTFKQ